MFLRRTWGADQEVEMREDVQTKVRDLLDRAGFENVTFSTEAVAEIPINPKTRKYQLIVPIPEDK